jgi:hypothetical protein
MSWQEQLISLYLFISKHYEKDLSHYCSRMSNYADLSFSDEEVIVIFMFGILRKQKELKSIYQYTSDHLSEWFPKLPSYVAFIQRLNKVADIFIPLVELLLTQYPEKISYLNNALLMDSMPIMLAQRGRRFHAKVAPDIATKNGYCATKKLHYYGVKLHVIGRHKHGCLPMPEYVGLTEAGMNDNKAFEQIAPCLNNDEIYADKAYTDTFYHEQGLFNLLTPIKKQKGQSFLDAADQALSTAVSRVRQPIESFFNWLEQKTSIQLASKVRSYQGLIVHVFGRISAALFSIIGFCS